MSIDNDTARALIATARHGASPKERARALENVVRAYLPLAATLSHRYGNRGLDMEDLEQVAALALMKAIERYDLDAATPFGAYATPTIMGELRRHFRDQGWLVRPPRPLQEGRQRLVRTREDLTGRLRREPAELELAEALDVSVEHLRRIQLAERNLRPASLDAPVGDRTVDADGSGSGNSLVDMVEQRAPDPSDIAEQLVVRDAVRSLSLVERQFVHLRYTEGLNQKEIADLLAMTPMAVSRLQKRTLGTLAARLNPLEPTG